MDTEGVTKKRLKLAIEATEECVKRTKTTEKEVLLEKELFDAIQLSEKLKKEHLDMQKAYQKNMMCSILKMGANKNQMLEIRKKLVAAQTERNEIQQRIQKREQEMMKLQAETCSICQEEIVEFEKTTTQCKVAK